MPCIAKESKAPALVNGLDLHDRRVKPEEEVKNAPSVNAFKNRLDKKMGTNKFYDFDEKKILLKLRQNPKSLKFG